jgi:phosphopantothenoylcysteine decarboxylase/phosphopantothenate--cysteine ligase
VYLKEITGTQGNELTGKTIALCVTASVSITEAPRIARMLMRHGAEVIAILTPKAAKFVSPMIFEWSTGNAPITKLTGRVEHVELVTSRRADLILIAPCTANTLAKISNGIADEPVSTLACTALGAGIPILIASAMHEPMYMNPIIREAREKLEKAKVRFVKGPLTESKSKLASAEEILKGVVSLIGNTSTNNNDQKTPSSLETVEKEKSKEEDLASVSLVITAGPTREPIDSVRFITNASSGKMGVALAEEALQRGAKSVCLIHGPGVTIPKTESSSSINGRILLEQVTTTQQMLESVLSHLSKQKYDALISAAAPADYAPDLPTKGKISTSRNPDLNVHLAATGKIISAVKEKFPTMFVVAFKAEYGLDDKDLIQKASDLTESSKADLVVANNVGREDIGFGSDFNEVFIVEKKTGDSKHLPKASKNEIASKILDVLVSKIHRQSSLALS